MFFIFYFLFLELDVYAANKYIDKKKTFTQFKGPET